MSEKAIKAFDRLDPALQESLYRMRWTNLRPIQVNAIHEVFDGKGDLLIAARTAAGKTEAAFLPILSTILAEPKSGIRAVYAGPLKALINDQFSRLEELCQEAEIPVHKWHGDVSSSVKRNMIERPSGVLLITPESIKSLFINHAQQLDDLFPRLSFIVIDELHSFIGNQRGGASSQLDPPARLQKSRAGPCAGLSATFGTELRAVREWLQPGDPDSSAHDRRPRQENDRVEDPRLPATASRSKAGRAGRGGNADRRRLGIGRL